MADEAAPFEESATAHAVDALTPTASPGASPVQPVALNFPLVLRYLQSEFRAFDWERSEWDLERAELHTHVARLEGEKRALEMLKMDLMRRVDMLERALRRERGMNVDDGASVEAEPSIAAPRPAATTHAAGFTSTRALLKQYLQEVGYVAAEEADHDYQAALERAAHTYPRKPFYDHEDDYHGTNETLNHGLFTMAKAPTAVKSTLPAAFESGTVDILKRPVASAASASDQKENYERASVTVTDTESMTSKTSEGSPTTDLDESFENASDTFKFSSAKSQKMFKAWNNMYAKTGSETGTVIARGNDDDCASALASSIGDKAQMSERRADENTSSSPGKSKAKTKKNVKGEPLAKTSAVVDRELAELVDDELMVDDTDTNMALSRETKDKKPVTKQWRPKFTLRGHLDSVRSVVFHPTDVSLASASEDGTIRYWALDAAAKMKRPPADIESIHAFRGHRGPVTSLAMSTMIPSDADPELEARMQFGVLYSAGVDHDVRVWGVPDKTTAPYAKYDHRHHAIARLTGHTDVVWEVVHHPMRPLLASSSADGTVRLWNLNGLKTAGGDDHKQLIEMDSSALTLRLSGGGKKFRPVPTAIDFVQSDMTKVIISFANSALQLFDLETGKVVTETFNGLAPTTDTRPNSTQINRVITHRTMPIAITAHEDRTIRFFDLRAHECQHTMVAHLDAVATLDISPNGMVLVSGGHDSSVRLWDIGSRACLQEFTAHRKTYDEAIHTARFHPRASAAATGGALAGGSSWLATGGADACVKVFTCS